MKTNWPVVELDTLTEGDRSITYGVVKPGEEVEDGVAFVRGGDILAGKLALGSLRTISPSLSQVYKRTILRGGELLISLVGNPGEVAIAPTELVGANIARQVGLVPLGANVSSRFVMYFLMSPNGRAELFTRTGGAVQQVINLADLKTVKIPVPPIQVQERIADTLSAYDDLIENNRRRMALLEESARLLYREWFVHLRFPGHEPTRHINGVPQGWALKPLEEVAEFRLGKMLDEKKNRGEPLPYLANVNVRWGEFDLTNLREMRFEEHELETFGLKFGDIVMCEGGEPGRCAIWKEQMPGMMFQKAIHRIRCREDMEPEYLYQSLRHQAETGHFATLFTGATIKHFPREKLAKVTVVVPPKRLLDLFTSFARPIETQLAHLEAANKRARDARDLLLPRLMSGEIEV